MTNLEKFLAKSRELREAATPGIWTHKAYEEWGYGTKHWIEPIESIDSSRYYLSDKGPANLDFIAHARNTAEIKDEMIRMMAEALNQIKNQRDKTCWQLDKCKCIVDTAFFAIERVEELAK